MGAKIVKLKINKKNFKERDLTPFQKKLLGFPVMTNEEFKEYKKINKWMGKWKI